jgi:hypothetical protein
MRGFMGSRTFSTQQKPKEGLMRHLIGILTLSLLVLAPITSVLAEEDTVTEQVTAASVTLTSPKVDAIVTYDGTSAEGTCNPSTVDHIWVFVWPQHSGKGYPQSKDASHLSCKDGHWKTPLIFRGKPQSFEVTVYLATPKVSKNIARVLAEWSRTKSYPGMDLPHGLVKQDSVWVEKQQGERAPRRSKNK